MARDGDTMIYTTACCDAAPEEGAPGARHGSPLQVHYAERFSAAGRTSGGYVKRDGRAKEHEILISRLVDRPLRPLLPADWRRPTQVLSWVLSFDGARGTEALAVTAAGAALALSAVPIRAAVAAVRVGLIPGRGLVLDPDSEEVEASVLDLLVAGSAEGLLMVEAGAEFVTEADMLEAIAFGQAAVQKMCVAIDAWAAQVGKPAAEASEASDAGDLEGSAALDAVRARFGDAYETLHRSALDKAGREAALRALRSEAETARRLTAREGVRMDGRAPDAVRGISCRAGALPRTHGSALFTRGETQVLAVATLGCEEGVRRLDSMAGQEDDRFYLQYFFPPSCRALAPAVPPEAEFPYSIRLESTVTESNGSSSMATVCAGCLALLDAGVPLKGLVAGVAMGLADADAAAEAILALVDEPERGRVYRGARVTQVLPFGALVEILDVLDGGKLRLSRKALLDPVEGYDAEAAAAAAAEAGAQRGNGGADDGARYKRRRPRGEGAGNGAPRRYARGPPRERQASPDSSAASADTTA
ncbi:Polyribonucleotide nucleotidyltransferase [Auxenochlorella protothecoides]|uniref:Polyribonucleotide nucleotidyltransferase n=1 Tax=Auxenochlorella protothecoides TaxID=3075 RepID=A0A087SQW0_AUXPR|nr:Polyribonucleotide nucleotidyltransferase [Auxenochlorella protothecoides]KFM28114.1 Polyribonucleotide nucleotidyltransferase [Auxenochlorella protothecoides]